MLSAWLLQPGLYTSLRRLFAFLRDNERYGDLTEVRLLVIPDQPYCHHP
jgi:hypothetical protein